MLGLLLYLWTLLPFGGLDITFVDAISVGATLSATDPVTILAIFNVYKVEPKLYTVIFGESILNDAIAIVLFETAQRYKPGSAAGSLTVISLFEAIGVFLLVFFGSLLIGVIVGIVTALGLKYTHVRREPKIESCLIVLIAYASYFFSTGVHMSGKLSHLIGLWRRSRHADIKTFQTIGIVSLLFCGITLKHYAYYNMSRRTQLTTKYIFQIMAQLSENFIFIYLGLDLFTDENLQFDTLFIIVTVVGICIARYMSVFPLSKAINWFIRYRAKRHGKEVAEELPFSYQAMLYWAGLRGAVGVALAAGLEGTNAPTLRATVLVVVVLTVIIFGGTTARMLEILDIRTGVVEEIDSDDEFDIEVTNGGTYYKRSGTGLGHTPRRSDSGIPLGAVDPADDINRTGAGFSSGSNGRLTPQQPETSSKLAARKKTAYLKHDRKARSRDAASTRNLLSRSDSLSGSGSGSGSNDSPATDGNGTRRKNRHTRSATDGDLDDFELDLDGLGISDDDLPPAVARTMSQQHLSPASHLTPAGSSRSPVTEGPSSDAAQAAAGASTSSGSRHGFAGFRDLFSGASDQDHTTWFKQLDEEYIKPKLLLDQGSGRKGPDAV